MTFQWTPDPVSDAVHHSINENASFFFETFIFDACFGKYKWDVFIWNCIGRFIYFLEYALPTRIQLHHLDTIFYCLNIYVQAIYEQLYLKGWHILSKHVYNGCEGLTESAARNEY